MSVSANDSYASSLLPLRPGASPHARTVATEEVEVGRLDDVVDAEGLGRAFLKCDGQARSRRCSTVRPRVLARCVLVEAEQALVERYEGQALFGEAGAAIEAQARLCAPPDPWTRG
jgi:hypothetical protein